MTTSELRGGLSRTVMRGAGIAGGGFAVTLGLGLGFYLLLARLATPADFGVFAAGSLFVGIGTVFGESGMLAAVIQRRDRVEEAANTALIATLASGVGLTLLALVLAPVAGLLFDDSRVTTVAAALSGWLFLNLAAVVPNALLQRRFSFVRRVVVEPLAIIAFGVAASVACAAGLGVWGLVIGTYASGAMHTLLSWALVRWRPRAHLASVAMWRDLVRFGRHVFVSELLIRASTAIDTFLLGRFVGANSLGQYRYAYRIASVPLLATVNVAAYVLYPVFARIAVEEERLKSAFVRAVHSLGVLVAPAAALLLALGQPIAVLVLGERWRPAGEALMAMSGYAVGGAAVSVASEAFKAAGNPQSLPRVHALWTGLTAVLMVAALPLGLVGIAGALSAASLLVAVYAFRRVAIVLGLPLLQLARPLAAPAAAAAAVAAVLVPLELVVIKARDHAVLPGLGLLACETVLGIVIYGVLLELLAPGTLRTISGRAASPAG